MTTAEYNQCVEQFSDGVYRFIAHQMRNREEAKDVVQDTFEKVWNHCGSVDFVRAKSYIFQIAHNAMIDKIRKDKRKTDFSEVKESKYSVEYEYTDTERIVRKAMEKLPDAQREVILLRDFEGYDYKEIGEILNLSESQVKVYIFRARTFLKNYLGSMQNVI
ncbi:MAG: RNA polymerase sigma factor [Bacteroidetes bacterium]|nr:RNA polymerase sigma factor [Bacteroidota bacterium]